MPERLKIQRLDLAKTISVFYNNHSYQNIAIDDIDHPQKLDCKIS